MILGLALVANITTASDTLAKELHTRTVARRTGHYHKRPLSLEDSDTSSDEDDGDGEDDRNDEDEDARSKKNGAVANVVGGIVCSAAEAKLRILNADAQHLIPALNLSFTTASSLCDSTPEIKVGLAIEDVLFEKAVDESLVDFDSFGAFFAGATEAEIRENKAKKAACSGANAKFFAGVKGQMSMLAGELRGAFVPL